VRIPSSLFLTLCEKQRIKKNDDSNENESKNIRILNNDSIGAPPHEYTK